MLAQHSSGNQEHYTPKYIIDAVREVLGEDFLDPATSVTANLTVKAPRFYTKEDNGLAHPWEGKVFLNPPGAKARPRAADWWEYLVNEFVNNRVKEAIFIGYSLEILQTTQNCPIPVASATHLCFPSRRIKFTGGSPTHGNVIAYLADDENLKFRQAFGHIGVIR